MWSTDTQHLGLTPCGSRAGAVQQVRRCTPQALVALGLVSICAACVERLKALSILGLNRSVDVKLISHSTPHPVPILGLFEVLSVDS
jgi:hypothetical protein